MGGRITYRTLSPKRTPFEIGIDWWSHLRKAPRIRRISHPYPMWLWGCSPHQISSPGPVFHGTKWLLWRPHIQSPTLQSRCGINKGLIKRGSTIDHWRSRCKGWILWPTPYTYIKSHPTPRSTRMKDERMKEGKQEKEEGISREPETQCAVWLDSLGQRTPFDAGFKWKFACIGNGT
jgi:hypothetical protein